MTNPGPSDAPLQFDTATLPDAAGVQQEGTVSCSACLTALTSEYFDINGQTVCEACRDRTLLHAQTPREWSVFARAGLCGFGAALAGAALYYGVIALTELEIGIVAIAIGYMVGYAVRFGAKGRGGRRFQVAALVLTYWAVGLAYVPLAFSDATESSTESTAETEPATVAPVAGGEEDPGFLVTMGTLVAFVVAFSFALPVLYVFGSLPGGLISAAIIAFGMHQAWAMTGVPDLQVTGPFRVGSGSASLV